MRMALFLWLLLAVGAAQAESVYVNDVLRVGVRTQPDSNETPVAVVISGTELSVLERRDGYVRIRTPDGVEGWVSDSYVVNEPPARLLLAQAIKERDSVKAQLAELQKSLAARSAQADELLQRVDELQQQNARLQASIEALTVKVNASGRSRVWVILSLLMTMLFGIGIYLGVRWNKERVAQRLGGLEL